MLTVVVISKRDEVVLFAPGNQSAPLKGRHQMPAGTLRSAGSQGCIKSDAGFRILSGERIGAAILHDVLILGNIDRVNFLTIHDEGRESSGGSAEAQLGIGHFRNLHHDGRDSLVIKNHFIAGSQRGNSQRGKIKVSSHLFVPPYSMLHRESVHLSRSSGTGVRMICSGSSGSTVSVYSRAGMSICAT